MVYRNVYLIHKGVHFVPVTHSQLSYVLWAILAQTFYLILPASLSHVTGLIFGLHVPEELAFKTALNGEQVVIIMGIHVNSFSAAGSNNNNNVVTLPSLFRMYGETRQGRISWTRESI